MLRVNQIAFVWAVWVVGACSVQAQVFDFAFDPAASGVVGELGIDVDSRGTLVGSYDPTNNPTGTRTKPGLFGAFGPTENVAVPTTLGVGVGGPINPSTAGGMRLTVDLGAGTTVISGFASSWVEPSTVTLPVTLDLAFSSFRTRSPDSSFPGIPVSLPFGQATLSGLVLQQTGAPGTGTAAQTPDGIAIEAVVPVELSGTLELLGQTLPLAGIVLPLPVGGLLTSDNDGVFFAGERAIDLSERLEIAVELPTFPLDLPTVLPPGQTAGLLLSLTLESIDFSLDATQRIEARGAVVPSPELIGVAWIPALLMRRRSRGE